MKTFKYLYPKVDLQWMKPVLKELIKKFEMEFKQYKRKGLLEMVEWSKVPKGDRAICSISEVDQKLAETNPEEFEKGYLARNPKNHKDLWYIAKKYFDENLEEA